MWANYNETPNKEASITDAVSKTVGNTSLNVRSSVGRNAVSRKVSTIVEGAVDARVRYLKDAFFAGQKSDILQNMKEAKAAGQQELVKEIFEANKGELNRHRNIFKLFATKIAPGVAEKLFEHTKSFKLAKTLLEEEAPTEVISKDLRLYP